MDSQIWVLLIGIVLLGLTAWFNRPGPILQSASAYLLRSSIDPIVFFAESDSQAARARALAAWPDQVRVVMHELPSISEDQRLAVGVSPWLELFPLWDLIAARQARRADLISHAVRHSLCALAQPEPAGPLAVARLGETGLLCPDPRIMIGRAGLVAAARSLAGEDEGYCLGAFRVGVWIAATGLILNCSDEEIAFQSGATPESHALLLPTLHETILAEKDLHVEDGFARRALKGKGLHGTGSVVLPSL